MTDRAYTLYELLAEVRGLIKTAFSSAYWVVAEIAEAKEHQRGHCYLTLVERQEKGVVAQIKANIWAYEYSRLLQKFCSVTGENFRPGMKVMLLVTVDCHEQYGMSLTIKDVEPSFSLGEMALKKRETIERLTREGLMDRNKALLLPLAPQKIAVVSSAQAAGYGDFIDQITANPFGYKFRVRLFPALMQGEEAEGSILRALGDIILSGEGFDLTAIIRGGGSAIDLSCFDSYGLAAAVANFPMPVITGIGHEKDDTVVDMVAHTRLKTPTAAAEFLISGLRAFEERLIGLYQRLEMGATKYLSNEQQRLQWLSARFINASRGLATASLNRLEMLHLQLTRATMTIIERHFNRLERLEQALRLLSPEAVLRRGYSITTHKGKVIKDISHLKDGDEIQTQLKDCQFTSIYKNRKKEGKRVARGNWPNLFSGID